MEERKSALAIISAGDIQSINPNEIDATVNEMIQASKKNGEDLQQLALECSSALASAQGRTTALETQGCFKRLWNNASGKNEKLRCAIERDNLAAQYAMQQTITGVLAECVRNQELTLAVKSKLEKEILRIETYQVSQDRELNRIRQALVAFYESYLEQNEKIYEEIRKQNAHAGRRCEYCRCELSEDQIVCHHCGTIQELKLEKLPMETQEKIRQLSDLMKKTPETWNPDIYWDMAAQKYAGTIAKAREISEKAGFLTRDNILNQDIENLIAKCRNSEFQIAVVGLLKAGKSMLMNALIGTELAATATNSMTAALTKFRSTPEENRINVRFYSSTEWNALNKSANESAIKGAQSVDSDQVKEKPLHAILARPEIQEKAKKWINHAPLSFGFPNQSDLTPFQAEVRRWTSAASDDHLFVAEVEVFINKNMFDMPQEVVFVDTPGLQDPVKYRSEITENYIAKADAVIIAAKIDAFRNEEYVTITKILDQVGSNRDKVFIVGTQKDLRNSEYNDEVVCGKGGWIDKLVGGRYYATREEAERRIYLTSAYVHLLMSKVRKLTVEELDDERKFSAAEYRELENEVKKALNVKHYNLQDFPSDKRTIMDMEAQNGIEKFRQRLDSALIRPRRNFKIQDISNEFAHCRGELMALSMKKAEQSRELIATAQAGNKQLQQKIEDSNREKVAIETDRTELEQAIEKFKEFVEGQIRTSANAGRSSKIKER